MNFKVCCFFVQIILRISVKLLLTANVSIYFGIWIQIWYIFQLSPLHRWIFLHVIKIYSFPFFPVFIFFLLIFAVGNNSFWSRVWLRICYNCYLSLPLSSYFYVTVIKFCFMVSLIFVICIWCLCQELKSKMVGSTTFFFFMVWGLKVFFGSSLDTTFWNQSDWGYGLKQGYWSPSPPPINFLTISGNFEQLWFVHIFWQ